MISKEDKYRIAARLFFSDNQDEDGYEDFHEAFTEFSGTNKPSEQFVDFAIANVIKPQDGLVLLMDDGGHVCSYNDEDGFFKPVTPMSQEDGLCFEDELEKGFQEWPDIEGVEILQKLGWRVIA